MATAGLLIHQDIQESKQSRCRLRYTLNIEVKAKFFSDFSSDGRITQIANPNRRETPEYRVIQAFCQANCDILIEMIED